jgi:thiol-disulfide isomerase/thioredoxin
MPKYTPSIRATRKTVQIAALLTLLFVALPGWSADARLGDAAAIPHVGAQARVTYSSEFLQSDLHRAFAIAPGGAWGWVAGMNTAETASHSAVEACQKLAESKCVAYAVDDQLVFDKKTGLTLWGPYKSKAQAGSAPVGKQRGERFPDLAFSTGKGKPLKLSDWRGKVTVLHFWGSWCTPCKRELPDLQKVVSLFKNSPDIAFILLPVRENIAASKQWLASQRLELPLFDAGAKSSEDEFLKLADGGKIKDRAVANVFPTTYVLDRHGIVVFSHAGPISDWPQYAPFLRDAAAKSGKN